MAGFHPFKWATAGALLWALTNVPCIAQDAPDRASMTDEAPREVSRQEWMERVQEAKQRAKARQQGPS